ncbi:MAG: GDSL-type esterase/lipase family protein [Verrucomicrobiales bacterium]|nr:GDSL-type esterase/lipase family protein [Verrucomicrobiales bacterium]
MLCFFLKAGLVVANEREAKPWVAQISKNSDWLKKSYRLNRQATKLNPEICFVGDSLTEFWNAQGDPIWQLEFHDKRVANLGLAADRVENILWRLKNGGLAKIKPKIFVVMLGTNNLSKQSPDSPDEVARGVAEVLKLIRSKLPQSRVLLLSILPNGYDPRSKLRKSVRVTNEALREMEVEGEVEFLDIHDAFLNAQGAWKRTLTLDGTHLTMRGYELWMNHLHQPLADALR